MKAVDLFCGCGGLSLGFQQAGYNVVAAYDNWDAATDVYRLNFSHPVHKADLMDAGKASESIARYAPEIIIGGRRARITVRREGATRKAGVPY